MFLLSSSIVLCRSSSCFFFASYARTADQTVTSPASTQHSTGQSPLYKSSLWHNQIAIYGSCTKNHRSLLSAPFTLLSCNLPCATAAGGVSRPRSGALVILVAEIRKLGQNGCVISTPIDIGEQLLHRHTVTTLLVKCTPEQQAMTSSSVNGGTYGQRISLALHYSSNMFEHASSLYKIPHLLQTTTLLQPKSRRPSGVWRQHGSVTATLEDANHWRDTGAARTLAKRCARVQTRRFLPGLPYQHLGTSRTQQHH